MASDNVTGEVESTEPPNTHSLLLRVLHDVLCVCGPYSVGRIWMLCRDTAKCAASHPVWVSFVQAAVTRWALACAPEEEISDWHRTFFSLLRPRLDGIYVSQCGYLHRMSPGSSMTSSKLSMWVDYRRYVRLFPPDENGALRALVLQDAGPLEVAVEVLLGLDPCTHVAASRQSGLPAAKRNRGLEQKPPREMLRDKTCSAKYEFRDGHVDVTYRSDDGEFRMLMLVSHQEDVGFRAFSEELMWKEYSLTHGNGEVVQFNLGRRAGGGSADSLRDHFPPMVFRRASGLEHLLI
eukprot:gnl/TRDRNA2_/TRDRNA2_190352_c0_seq1.p1 gnl/TRDRNA2_/TRDRNA2_190352_c0~~gnl/TRDRNA2_/TRDRNA2_190352_c0_seq1.p1  ORF type:complete len:293 (+),score=35.75 gnl/TRDRNA2_/TRDRNA2_190352_c0_seq1:150-1028(+)